MRAIDADAFDKCLENAEAEAIHMKKHVFASAINVIRGNLRSFPTIEERKTGRWIYSAQGYTCSECKTQFPSEVHYLNHEYTLPKHCPECGAMMRKDGEAGGGE